MESDQGKALTSKQSKILMRQMEKSLCRIPKINSESNSSGTGFLCKIPTPVLITNNHVLNKNDIEPEKEITISFEDDEKTKKIKIDNERKTYTITKLNGYEVDVTIIEIKPEEDDLLEQEFIELDENLFENDVSNIYKGENIYVIQYSKDGSSSFASGIIKRVPKKDESFNVNHTCSTEVGSGGSPIILYNSKVIGVHRGCLGSKFNYNVGTLLKYPVEEFRKENLKNI